MVNPLSNELLRKIIEENGCFALVYRRDRHLNRGVKRVYFYFRPHFAITMKEDKKELMEQVKESLGSGKISVSNKQVRLDIFSPEDAKSVIRLFEKHKFKTPNSQWAFDLWKESLRLIAKYRKKAVNAEKGKRGFTSIWNDVSAEDMRRLFRIREEMKRYKKWRKNEYKWTHSRLASPFRV